MTSLALIDNDIVLKVCCFSLGEQFLELLIQRKLQPSLLGVAKFVLTKRVRKSKKLSDRDVAIERVEEFLNKTEILEPSEEEILLAAQFESVARELNLAFDIGESQLLSVLICRCAGLFITGDKRAIKAIPTIILNCEEVDLPSGKVMCLEQAMLLLLENLGPEVMHKAVCGERDLDTSMDICFRCVSGVYSYEEIAGSLTSYINDLRTSSEQTLIHESNF